MLPGRGRLAVAAGTAMLAIASGSALGAAAPGPEWHLNKTVENYQQLVDLAPLPGGAFVAVWESESHDGSADAVVFRRFDASGTPLDGDEVVVNGNGNNVQQEPAVASAPDGRFVVAWRTYFGAGPASNEVRARAYNADGTPAPSGELAVNTATTGSQQVPDVGMASDGSFVVVWESSDASPQRIVARRYGAGGTGPGAEITVGSAASDGAEPAIAVEPGGGFVVTWADYGGVGGGDVWFRRYDAADAPVGAAAMAHTSAAGGQDFPAVALRAGGGFVLAWNHTSADPPVRARLFGSDGLPQSDERRVPAGTSLSQGNPAIATAPDGTFSIAWEGPSPAYLYARRFDASLAPLTEDIAVPEATSTNSAQPDIISFADRFVVGFEHDEPDDPLVAFEASGVFARSFPFDPVGGSGSPPPPPGGGDPAPPPPGGGDPAPPPPGPSATGATPPAAAATSAPALPATTTPAAPARPVKIGHVLASVPSTRRCLSRRSFRIRLRHPQGARIATATVRVDGKRVATRRGKRVTAAVNLRGLPRGRFTVEIAVKLADGRTVKGKRRYRTCAPKRRGGRPRV